MPTLVLLLLLLPVPDISVSICLKLFVMIHIFQMFSRSLYCLAFIVSFYIYGSLSNKAGTIAKRKTNTGRALFFFLPGDSESVPVCLHLEGKESERCI